VLRHDREAEQVVDPGHDLGLDPVNVDLKSVARVVEGSVVLIQKWEEVSAETQDLWRYLTC
jgi:hypothetical protein